VGDLIPLAAVGAVGVLVGRYLRGRGAGAVGATARTAGAVASTAGRTVGVAGSVVATTGAGVSGLANGMARQIDSATHRNGRRAEGASADANGKATSGTTSGTRASKG
jgi:hypothetical protein